MISFLFSFLGLAEFQAHFEFCSLALLAFRIIAWWGIVMSLHSTGTPLRIAYSLSNLKDFVASVVFRKPPKKPPTSSKFRICNRAPAFKLIVASSAFDSIQFIKRFIVVLLGAWSVSEGEPSLLLQPSRLRNFPQFDNRSLQVRCFQIISIKFAARTSFCEGENTWRG